MADEAPRCGVVWCGPREPALPTFLCASDLLFFFFFFPTREGGRRIGFCERGERRGGAGGRVERLPAVSGHGTPALQPRRTGPPRTQNHRTPLVGHACTGARTIPTHPGPSPFAADEWTYVSFVLTFFSVFETQPTNTSSFFSHNNRDQGTKKGKSGKSFTTQRKDEPRVRLPVQAAADRRQRRGKVVPPAALR